MCRRASSLEAGHRLRQRRLRVVAVLGCVLLAGIGVPVDAQTADDLFPLESRTRRQLVAFQDSWIEWLAAMQQGEVEAAATMVETMHSEARALGMIGLPDLAAAAAVQAVAFAEGDELEKARAALEAAERLQPGEPAVAFARMSVASSEGSLVEASLWWMRAAARTFSSPISRRAAAGNLVNWILVVLTLSAFSLVGLQMATRGSVLVHDLAAFIGNSLPLPAAYVLAGGILVWPVFLPAGLLWLAIYWSVLLWGYGTRAERAAMMLAWVFVGLSPVLVSEHVRRLDLGVSVPLRALDNMAEGRLSGTLFSDLGVLLESLPESVAVKHLEADLHLQLRQWEIARNIYSEILTRESGNASALANLGAVYFHEGDLDRAIQYLQQAAAAPEVPVEVYFNLSRALSEQYRFAESEAMLRRASALDSRAVGDWISEQPARRVVRAPGGVARREEIKSELLDTWRVDDEGAWTNLWRRMLSAPLALVLVGPAVGVYLLARRRRRRVPRESEPWFAGSAESFRAVFLPGLLEAEKRQPGRAWFQLVLTLAILTLPFSSGFGFSIPVGYVRPFPVTWVLAAVLLGVYLLFRAASRRRERSKRA